ncbi:hypothetical protein GQ457_17G011170 [Hibiscus cannabinus]
MIASLRKARRQGGSSIKFDQGCSPSDSNPSSALASLLLQSQRLPTTDRLLVRLEPKTSPFNNHPKGTTFVTSWYTHGLASSYLEGCNFLTAAVSTPANSLAHSLLLLWDPEAQGDFTRLGFKSHQQPICGWQPLTLREQAGQGRRGVGVGRAAALLKTIARGVGCHIKVDFYVTTHWGAVVFNRAAARPTPTPLLRRSIGDNLPLGWLLKGEVLGSSLTNNLSVVGNL